MDSAQLCHTFTAAFTERFISAAKSEAYFLV